MPRKDWDALVASAPTIPLKRSLKRCVAQLSWNKSKKYLFTSGKRNRCNPKGVLCIYLSEDRATALAEWDKYYTDTGDDQPAVLYTGSAKGSAIIDLGDPKARKHFGLKDDDFFTPFRTKPETKLEKLGAAIAWQKPEPGKNLITGIRFPSDAQHKKGKEGYNIVLFKKAVHPPDYLRIKGPNGEALDEWPEDES